MIEVAWESFSLRVRNVCVKESGNWSSAVEGELGAVEVSTSKGTRVWVVVVVGVSSGADKVTKISGTKVSISICPIAHRKSKRNVIHHERNMMTSGFSFLTVV